MSQSNQATVTTHVLRDVAEQIYGNQAEDGDGVKLVRVFGGARPERFDPFLLMDEFGSDEAADYIGGFPPHPHRGFETVTYMLQGKMEHRDHLGNVGLLNDSDVQWMTAGAGIVHSEMPRQTEGRMRGFQFWVNLPARRKMTPPSYKDVPGDEIPMYVLEKGLTVKAIAGRAEVNAEPVNGYFTIEDTNIVILDIVIPAGARVQAAVNEDFNCMTYQYEGRVVMGPESVLANKGALTRFTGDGDLLVVNEGVEPARLLLLAGKPLREPIVQYGPFVMNSIKEIEQALKDFNR